MRARDVLGHPGPVGTAHAARPARLTALVAALAFAAGAAACGRAQDSAVAEIHGAWSTDASAYAGRGFDLSADSIRLHQGGGITVQYPILRVRRALRDDHVAYTLTYQGIVQPLDFRFRLHPDDQPFITFPNQPHIVWTLTPPSAASAALPR